MKPTHSDLKLKLMKEFLHLYDNLPYKPNSKLYNYLANLYMWKEYNVFEIKEEKDFIFFLGFDKVVLGGIDKKNKLIFQNFLMSNFTKKESAVFNKYNIEYPRYLFVYNVPFKEYQYNFYEKFEKEVISFLKDIKDNDVQNFWRWFFFDLKIEIFKHIPKGL